MESDKRYWVGVDGGGTKTDLQIVSSSGRVLAAIALGGSNPNQSDAAEISRMFDEGRRRGLLAAGLSEHSQAEGTIFCLGGLNKLLKKQLGKFPEFGKVKFFNDPMAILELCGEGGPCAILHAGTGSFLAARDVVGKHSCWGGYGPLLREPGSAWDIGRRAVNRVLDEMSGVETASAFGERMQSISQKTNLPDLIESVYGKPSPVSAVAGYASVVGQMLEEGDPVAEAIIRRSFGELGGFAARAFSEFFDEMPDAPRGISGKLFSSPRSFSIMREILASKGLGVNWQRIHAAPIEGVRRMLVKWAAGDPLDYKERRNRIDRLAGPAEIIT